MNFPRKSTETYVVASYSLNFFLFSEEKEKLLGTKRKRRDRK